jgi:hypothetical protein
MIRNLGLIFLLVVHFSCTTNDSSSRVGKASLSLDSLNNYTLQELVDIDNLTVDCTYTLEKSGEVAFAVDSLSWTFSLYPYYFDTDSGNYFASNNRITNSIDIYSMASGQMIKRVSFPTEGPGLVTRLDNFDIHSYDSVFIYDKGLNTLNLANLDGQIVDHYFPPDRALNEFSINVHTKFKIHKGQFFSARLPFVSTADAQDSALVARFDLVLGQLDYVGPRFIKAITRNSYFSPGRSLHIAFGHKNVLVQRVGVLPFVFVYHLDNESLKVHQVKSRHHINATPPPELDSNGMPVSDRRFFTDHYSMVMFDKWQNVYYHIFSPGVEEVKDLDTRMTVDDVTKSIIITDTAFNYLGEYLLPKNTYQRSYWVSREGLMVSTSHPKNPTLDEDTMRYATFKLKRVE